MRALVFNIGNTSLDCGVWKAGRLTARFRTPVREAAGAAGFRERVLPRLRGPFAAAAFASVVPEVADRIVPRIARAAGIAPVRLTAASAHGLRIDYREPSRLGADRLATALGARDLFPGKDVIVVDAGTATTVTALDRRGAILGGAILPGIGLWSWALAARTAQLPEIPLRRPRTALGRSPREAIESGIIHGHAGAVKELVRRIAAEAFGGRRHVVVGTGGFSGWLADAGLFAAREPALALRGLRVFAESMHWGH